MVEAATFKLKFWQKEKFFLNFDKQWAECEKLKGYIHEEILCSQECVGVMEIAAPSGELREPLLLGMFLVSLKHMLGSKDAKKLRSLVNKCSEENKMKDVGTDRKERARVALNECLLHRTLCPVLSDIMHEPFTGEALVAIMQFQLKNYYMGTKNPLTDKIANIVYTFSSWRESELYKQIEGGSSLQEKERRAFQNVMRIFNRLTQEIYTECIAFQETLEENQERNSDEEELQIKAEKYSLFKSKHGKQAPTQKLKCFILQRAKGNQLRFFVHLFKDNQFGDDFKLFLGDQTNFIQQIQRGEEEDAQLRLKLQQFSNPKNLAQIWVNQTVPGFFDKIEKILNTEQEFEG